MEEEKIKRAKIKVISVMERPKAIILLVMLLS